MLWLSLVTGVFVVGVFVVGVSEFEYSHMCVCTVMLPKTGSQHQVCAAHVYIMSKGEGAFSTESCAGCMLVFMTSKLPAVRPSEQFGQQAQNTIHIMEDVEACIQHVQDAPGLLQPN